MMESRGNLHYPQGSTNIGVDQVGQTLHFGPSIGSHSEDAWRKAHYLTNNPNGFDTGFHSYKVLWSLSKREKD